MPKRTSDDVLVGTDQYDAELDSQQRMALDIAARGANMIILGSAGTGKSRLVATIVKMLDDRYAARAVVTKSRRIVCVVAPTGRAACQIGGMTAHRFFRFNPAFPPDGRGMTNRDAWRSRVNADYRHKMRLLGTLIIDEISMLDAEFLEVIDVVLRDVRGSIHPFGGVQVIVVGDFRQLPPMHYFGDGYAVAALRGERQFAFHSPLWTAAFLPQHTVQLCIGHRQATDLAFWQLLQRMRTATMTAEDHATLRARILPAPPETLHLFCYNRGADAHNREQLAALRCAGEPDIVLAARIVRVKRNSQKKLDLDKPLPVEDPNAPGVPTVRDAAAATGMDETITLRVGCRVLLTRNSPNLCSGVYNGATGTLLDRNMRVRLDVPGSLGADVPMKLFVVPIADNGSSPYVYCIEQYALRLGYAVTVHKSQGMTLSRVHFGGALPFEAGQMYVAVSRVQSLSGLTLDCYNPAAAHTIADVDQFYKRIAVVAVDGEEVHIKE